MNRDLLPHLTTLRARAVTAAHIVPPMRKAQPTWQAVAAIARDATAPWQRGVRGDRALPPSCAHAPLP